MTGGFQTFDHVHLSQEDFENFTENYLLCDGEYGLTLEAFEKVHRVLPDVQLLPFVSHTIS